MPSKIPDTDFMIGPKRTGSPMPSLMGAKHADVMKAMPARIKAVVHLSRVEAAAPLVAWAAQVCRRHGSVLESVLIDTSRTAQVAPRVEFSGRTSCWRDVAPITCIPW